MKKIKGFGFIQDVKKNIVLYLMFLPIAIWFLVFRYLPLGGIIIAFKNFNYNQGIFFSPWNGFKNFEYFFKSGKAWIVTRNTFVYNLVFLACYIVFSILIAVLISEISNKKYKKTAQTFLFLPYFVSWVVISAFVYNFFDYNHGIINQLLTFFSREPINLSSEPTYWYFLLPFLYVWKWVGFGSVLYLAAISGINQECYESAMIDGANSFQKIYYITLPLLRPTTVILALLGVGRIMRGEFDMFYQLIGNNGLLMDSTDIIDTLVFRSLMGTSDFGMASSSAFYQSILCFVIIVTVNKIVKKAEPESALF